MRRVTGTRFPQPLMFGNRIFLLQMIAPSLLDSPQLLRWAIIQTTSPAMRPVQTRRYDVSKQRSWTTAALAASADDYCGSIRNNYGPTQWRSPA